MTPPDVIVAWPRTCDYPLWRQFITTERRRFARVLIAFTEHAGTHDYREFVRQALSSAECFDAPGYEWRDAAVNAALDRSDAEWIWFTEQDFLIADPAAFFGSLPDADAIGWWEEDNRWHPSCLFVRRALIERTDRWFGPEPVDHFVAFSRQLDALTRVAVIPDGWGHLQGLSQNHHLLDEGEEAGVFRRDRFRQYLRDCLAVTPLDPRWVTNAQKELAEG